MRLVGGYRGNNSLSTRHRAVAHLCVAGWSIACSLLLRRPARDESTQQGERPQLWKLLASIASIGTMLSGVAAMVLASLNCQGYMKSASSRFALPVLQRLALPGKIFDAEHNVKSLIPIFLHSLALSVVSPYYTAQAEILSQWDGTGSSGP